MPIEPSQPAVPNEPRALDTDARRESLARLSDGLAARERFLLVTGDAGTGKTTLLREVIAQWGERAEVAYVADPALGRAELLEEILRRFGEDPPVGATKSQLLACLEHALAAVAGRGRVPVLVVDDAHALPVESLDELLRVANVAEAAGRPLAIALAGLPALEARLQQPALASLRQRVAIRCTLAPFTQSETRRYLNEIAGGPTAKDGGFFPRKTCREIFARTGGAPRMVALLAAAALQRARDLQEDMVTPGHVQSVALALGYEPLGTGEVAEEDPEGGGSGTPLASRPAAPAQPASAPALTAQPANAPGAAAQPAKPAAPAPTASAPALAAKRASAPAEGASRPSPVHAPAAAAKPPSAPADASAAPPPASARVEAAAGPLAANVPPAAARSAAPPDAASERPLASPPTPPPDPASTPAARGDVSIASSEADVSAPRPIPTVGGEHRVEDWVGRFIRPEEPRFGSLMRGEGSRPPRDEAEVPMIHLEPDASDESAETEEPVPIARSRGPRPGGRGRSRSRAFRVPWVPAAVAALVAVAAVVGLIVFQRGRTRGSSARPQAATVAVEPPAAAGKDRVETRRGAPARDPASQARPDSLAAARQRFSLDAGSYLDVGRAEAERDRLRSASGLEAWVVAETRDGAQYHHVVVGIYRTRDRADMAANNLLRRGLLSEAQVIPLPPRSRRR